ncbi:hypothetical protein BDU57DRAFT_530382 [Ampelomyces quisqualis]|uniref:Uncharacterized protein n=1 Tax=Ampelomyces quisqualis TaxID=50730 RepID=A0A6A5QMX7_AMPQU|nr:hypothetical protein BDU57DRAFT_530382 [Ampelomyces quisqualis]
MGFRKLFNRSPGTPPPLVEVAPGVWGPETSRSGRKKSRMRKNNDFSHPPRSITSGHWITPRPPIDPRGGIIIEAGQNTGSWRPIDPEGFAEYQQEMNVPPPFTGFTAPQHSRHSAQGGTPFHQQLQSPVPPRHSAQQSAADPFEQQLGPPSMAFGRRSTRTPRQSQHDFAFQQQQQAFQQPFQLPSSPLTLREGNTLPPGVVDPIRTTSSRPLGYHGLREHVPGMTNLEVERHGAADDPRANWKVLEELGRLQGGGRGTTGGARRSRRDSGGGGYMRGARLRLFRVGSGARFHKAVYAYFSIDHTPALQEMEIHGSFIVALLGDGRTSSSWCFFHSCLRRQLVGYARSCTRDRGTPI